jgi:hypothetical protein
MNTVPMNESKFALAHSIDLGSHSRAELSGWLVLGLLAALACGVGHSVLAFAHGHGWPAAVGRGLLGLAMGLVTLPAAAFCLHRLCR